MNNVSLTGRITHDLELKVTPQNVHVLNFTIAVKKNRTKEDKTNFIDIECWRQSADFLSSYASQGTTIAVNGELMVEKYIDRDGNNRKKTYVLADSVEIINQPKDKPKTKTVEEENYDFNESIQGTEYANKFGGHFEDIEPDDLPFY